MINISLPKAPTGIQKPSEKGQRKSSHRYTASLRRGYRGYADIDEGVEFIDQSDKLEKALLCMSAPNTLFVKRSYAFA